MNNLLRQWHAPVMLFAVPFFSGMVAGIYSLFDWRFWIVLIPAAIIHTISLNWERDHAKN